MSKRKIINQTCRKYGIKVEDRIVVSFVAHDKIIKTWQAAYTRLLFIVGCIFFYNYSVTHQRFD